MFDVGATAFSDIKQHKKLSQYTFLVGSPPLRCLMRGHLGRIDISQQVKQVYYSLCTVNGYNIIVVNLHIHTDRNVHFLHKIHKLVGVHFYYANHPVRQFTSKN